MKKDKRLVGILSLAAAAAVVMGASIAMNGTEAAFGLSNGEYTVQSEPTESGDTGYVTVLVEDHAITKVMWDEQSGGEWKSVLSEQGKYPMKPIWKTQAESMCAYVVENQSTAGLNLDESGKTDVVAGVSISVNTFADLVNQAVAQANGADGVYEQVQDTVYVSVTMADGRITAVTWDEQQGGEWKSVLSEQGSYAMKPIWKTQAESMCAYVVENQSTAGLNLDESGKTDVVAGVSISVDTFVDLVNEAIMQAGGTPAE